MTAHSHELGRGASVNRFTWTDLLTQWSAETLEIPEYRQVLPPDVVASGWLGYPGATEEQFARVAGQLGAGLPPSYREFLAVTNGCWLVSGYARPYHFWSVEEVEWFTVRHEDWIDAWLDGLHTYDEMAGVTPGGMIGIYWPDQGEGEAPEDHLWGALEVSDEGDDSSIYLLNPQVVTPDGEWEAWYLNHDEVIVYRSFWKMLRGAHERFLAVRKLEGTGH